MGITNEPIRNDLDFCSLPKQCVTEYSENYFAPAMNSTSLKGFSELIESLMRGVNNDHFFSDNESIKIVTEKPYFLQKSRLEKENHTSAFKEGNYNRIHSGGNDYLLKGIKEFKDKLFDEETVKLSTKVYNIDGDILDELTGGNERSIYIGQGQPRGEVELFRFNTHVNNCLTELS